MTLLAPVRIIAIKLREEDELVSALLATEQDDLLFGVTQGNVN
jgi:hypothetical protein